MRSAFETLELRGDLLVNQWLFDQLAYINGELMYSEHPKSELLVHLKNVTQYIQHG